MRSVIYCLLSKWYDPESDYQKAGVQYYLQTECHAIACDEIVQ